MAKDKDPAFLFYSKDWLQGTAELMPDEKGVYIDLLAHQHQDGTLPNDTRRLARMVGLSQADFDIIWANISRKFKTTEDNRLVNHKLIKITTERSTKAHTKAILSRFAVLVKSAKNYPSKIIDKLKADFKVSDFESFEISEATERLTTWFSERLTTALGNGNANTNEDEIETDLGSNYQGGSNGTIPKSMVSRMAEIWTRRFPGYTTEKVSDSHALKSIADFIFSNAGISNGYGNLDHETKALNTFELIADQVNREPFWSNKSLKSISNHIQEFYNKIKNPTNGTGSKPTKAAGVDEAVLKQKANEYLDQRRQAGR